MPRGTLGLSLLDVARGDAPYTIFRTFWGAFGQLEVYFLWPYYVLLGLLSLAAGLGLAWGLLQWLGGPKDPAAALERALSPRSAFLPGALLLLALLALGMVALVYWQTWTTSFATQGRYLYPAIVPFVLFLTLGVSTLPLGSVIRPLAQGSALAFLFVLNLIGLFAYTVPTYYL